MYDPSTTVLIQSTPALEGLDRETLPDKLSREFANIAAARVRLRDNEVSSSSIEDLLEFAKKLAHTNEALVASNTDRDDRTAAAFVAATAHQLVFQATHLEKKETPKPFLKQQSISSDVAAMLLFLIGESSADATEVANAITMPSEGSHIEKELIRILRLLARGEVRKIVERGLPSKNTDGHEHHVELATSALYFTLIRGVRALAHRLLKGESDEDDAIYLFEQVKRLSATNNSSVKWLEAESVSIFSGPFHLSCLLIAVANELWSSATITISPPNGVPPDRWSDAMQSFASNRPFLWKNHRDAISKGYLETGVSSTISFPTGAGKSTVSQLKICTMLLVDKKVVFLAPTHALVDQTVRDMRSAFPRAQVHGERLDEFGLETGGEELPDILIMTPEACLLMIHFDPEVFEDVGLVVFDECHLLHPKDTKAKRAIDAMLCVLNLSRVAGQADFLLMSAMMKNADELSCWLAELTSRPSISLTMPWKPTRQLRGCVVYEKNDIVSLEALLTKGQKSKPTGGVPTSLKKNLTALPYGFFSVKQTWSSKYRKDYAYLPFMDKALPLSTNSSWRLTPNSGVVAAEISAASATAGVKTLVFSQSITNANSIAKKASVLLGKTSIKLTDVEAKLLEIAIDEVGDAERLYLKTDGKRVVTLCSVHHSQLIPEERRLVESLYKRKDGLIILTSTPTLGQGMNMPSELVIIAEDSRYDSNTGRKDILDAQDLLNAAGRAGRAGKNATGMVIVIPGKVVALDDKESKIGSRWTQLGEIFGQSDRCLIIDDPLAAVMDRIHGQVETVEDLDRYCISRLAKNPLVAGLDDGTELSTNLSRSFAAYRHRINDDQEWVKSRVASANLLLGDQTTMTDDERFNRELSSVTGFPEIVIEQLRRDMKQLDLKSVSTIKTLRIWLLKWLNSNPEFLTKILRSEDLESLFGKEYRDKNTDQKRASFSLLKINKLLAAWMAGKTLDDIQAVLPPKTRDVKYSTSARKFVTKIIPTLAHFFGLPALMFTHEDEQVDGEVSALLPSIVAMQQCVRSGFDIPEKAAFYELLGSTRPTRRVLHRHFKTITPFLGSSDTQDTWQYIQTNVENAMNSEINERDIDFGDIL